LSYADLTPEQTAYIRRLARRLIRLRKSSSIDEDDLANAAAMRWWQFSVRQAGLIAPDAFDVLFRQQVKFAMRDLIRESVPVKITRADQVKLQAYGTPYTVDIEHAVNITAGYDHEDPELWLDVVQALQRLPQREQLILSLSVDQGYSFTEIAYVLDVAVSTVTRAYHGAIEKLQKDLRIVRETRKKSPGSTDI
jgi:RNA polymerase sigma factor (sigma-70 family)